MAAAVLGCGGFGTRVGARPAPAPSAPAARSLTGVWTNAWYTRLERPKALKSLVVTAEDAEAFEAPRRAMGGGIAGPEDVVGQATSEFPENGPGLARIRGEIRSSWIIDPPDGKIPWSAEARARLGLDKRPVEDFDNVEARPTEERCLTAAGAGAPILNSYDGNIVQIVQTPDSVVIVSEKNHDARIVRLGDGPRPPAAAGVFGWMGASVGRWDGATLVVETTGLRPGVTRFGNGLLLSDRSRVVERFTRTSPTEIHYLFEVEDPTLFTRPWRAEMVFRPAAGRLYEYACHEGNYSLPSILSAARQGNQDPPAGPANGAN